MLEERGIEHAAGSQAWLRRTLEEIVSQVRRLLDVTGVSFLVVDAAHAHIRPAASWFASDAVRDAFVPVLDRPYEPERAGVTEAAIERGSPVRIERIEDWPGASGLHDRLFERQKVLPDGPARDAAMRAAKNMLLAYMPYKAHVHTLLNELVQPWVRGFWRHPFMNDLWCYVGTDAEMPS